MVAVEHYLQLLPAVNELPDKNVWISYDQDADVLYINFKKPSEAADSELTDDDIIIRYGRNDEVIGYTILHASDRTV